MSTNEDGSSGGRNPQGVYVLRGEHGEALGVASTTNDPGENVEDGPFIQWFWAGFRFRFYPGLKARFGEYFPELVSLIVLELAKLGSGFKAIDLGVVFEGEPLRVRAELDLEGGFVDVEAELQSCLEFEVLGEVNGIPTGVWRSPTQQ